MTVAALVLLGVSACGFQLRGETPMGVKSLYLSTAGTSLVAVEIRRALASGSTRLAAAQKDGEVHIRILTERRDKPILTLTGAGQVYEYVLRLKVGYQVSDAGGNLLIDPAELEVRRIISYSATAPLAKEAEEQILNREMNVDAAQQILRRVAALRRPAAP
jgi:LPS-assembly lipoprotein